MIGAGNFASSMLLPHFRGNSAVKLAAVATTSSLSAENARQKFGFGRATTDFNDVLADPTIDAVIIATRLAEDRSLALTSGKSYLPGIAPRNELGTSDVLLRPRATLD